ncbi:hypothetical protein BG006_000805 [Podila minutissima]|uniref:Uncharacterized protein n=1 Tax=Podila minutissima TaxID=64525 RepID=A0A9P5SQ07_9FUNG|nr:hypothetical protein BG006_000805 [Podila minutissima]
MEPVTFNVVGYPSSSTGSFDVNIRGSITRFTSNKKTFLIWRGSVLGSDGNVQCSPSRSFPRSLTPTGHLSLQDQGLKAQAGRHHPCHCPAAQIAKLNANPYSGKDYRVDICFVNSKTIHSVHNVTLKASGVQFKFDTNYNQTFFSCPNIKLRSMVMDPTIMREKLYIDILIPATDDLKNPFLKQTVHGGNGKIERGSLVKTNAWNENKSTLENKGGKTSDYNIYENLG